MSEFDRENRADALYETLLQHRPSIVYYSWRKNSSDSIKTSQTSSPAVSLLYHNDEKEKGNGQVQVYFLPIHIENDIFAHDLLFALYHLLSTNGRK